ncbi:hypothetical protein AVEN_201357-1 [Araneus ventricosus]|uniref:Uncharacterized protein n=1 Tax=Araneus ventricosus TaxID=182803 RepID=A0A4Y2KHY6_ARAVE|nr:hypothetical protein AVEN_201357-1 [Araneus ventricosus]
MLSVTSLSAPGPSTGSKTVLPVDSAHRLFLFNSYKELLRWYFGSWCCVVLIFIPARRLMNFSNFIYVCIFMTYVSYINSMSTKYSPDGVAIFNNCTIF